MGLFSRNTTVVEPDRALAGRPDYPYSVPETHEVLGTPIQGPFADGLEVAVFGMGCFWGSEELYWQVPGVYSTSVGYAGGYTTYPTYDEVCSGRTGQTEAVQVVFDPAKVAYLDLLQIFFENHDSTQVMRQGNDIGSQYRSAIYTTTQEQAELAAAAIVSYGRDLAKVGYDAPASEVAPLGDYFYAEGHHQQYLYKNPHGYRCHSKTGVAFTGG